MASYQEAVEKLPPEAKQVINIMAQGLDQLKRIRQDAQSEINKAIAVQDMKVENLLTSIQDEIAKVAGVEAPPTKRAPAKRRATKAPTKKAVAKSTKAGKKKAA